MRFWAPSIGLKETSAILRLIRESIEHGTMTSGPQVQKLESDFAHLVGTDYGVATNSCTSALHMILQSAGVKSGDEILTTSVTFAATANAAIFCGARIRFCDIDSETFNIDPRAVQEAITKKTKAVIVVHLGGNPCDMRELEGICSDSRVAMVEDAAHAHGSRIHGRYCGSFGAGGAFSFYPTKVLGGFEGGMITTNDETIAASCRRLRNHGRSGTGPQDVESIGYNYRMNEVQAIAINVQLPRLDGLIGLRNRVAKRYDRLLSRRPGIVVQKPTKDSRHSHYAYLVTVNKNRDKIRDCLLEKGIETSIMYRPLHLFKVYEAYVNGRRLPNAEHFGNSNIALPIHTKLSDEDIERVADELLDATDKVGA